MTDPGFFLQILQLLERVAQSPAAAFIFVILVVLFLTWLVLGLAIFFLMGAIKRAREDTRRRIEECEDAHLERDKIQISLVELVAEAISKLKELSGGRRGAADAQDYELRARKLVAQIHDLNDEMLERRKRDRAEVAELMRD